MVLWWQAWGRPAVLVAVAVFAAAVFFVLFCLFTPPGHAVLARLITPLTGGSVEVSGLSGSLPNHLEARHVELRDEEGPWLRADDVRLDWRFFALLGNHADVSRVRAARVVVLRRHVSTATASASPTKIDVADLWIGRIELAPPVLGRRAVLTATGSLHYLTRHDLSGDLSIRRIDGDGRYDVRASIAHDVARGTVTAAESGAGLAGGLIGMPDLGPVNLDVRAAAQGTLSTIRFKLTANALDVFGGGTIDLAARRADVDFSAVASAMHPNARLSWSSLSAKGHLHGTLDRPELGAALNIAGLNISGGQADRLEAQVTGTGGVGDLRLTAVGVRIPGANPGLFASSPAIVTAHVDLSNPSRPVRFAVDHPLLKLQGRLTTRGNSAGVLSADLPSLGAIAGIAGVTLEGTAKLDISFVQKAAATNIKLNGRIAARGAGALARLLGGNAKFAANASVRDAKNAAMEASLTGVGASATLGGQVTNGLQDFAGEFAVSDLSRAVSNLEGSLNLHWRLSGPADDIALNATGRAIAATKGMARQQVAIVARAAGLPKLKTATVSLAGSFDGSPLKVQADVATAGVKAFRITLANSSWRSASASGTMLLDGSQRSGSLTLKIARLADLSPLVGAAISGSADGRADFKSTAAVVHATARNISFGTTRIGRLGLDGNIADPFGNPALALAVAAEQLDSSGFSGSANARLDGPLQNLAVKLTSAVSTTAGQDFTVATDATVDATAKRAVFTRFEGVWRDQIVGLAAPATFDYGGDDMKFSATFLDGKSARLAVVGSIPAKAGRQISVKANGTADLGALASGLAATGQIVRGKAELNILVTGTTAKPQVTGSATISGGQIDDYGYGLALTDIAATAQAQGSTIRLTQFTARAGPGTITGSGTVDISAPGTPVDVSFKAANARPLVSDLMTATVNSDLKLEGRLSEHLTLSGKLNIRQASINVAEKLPAEVATLNVRRSHQAPPPPLPAPVLIALDLTISSPGQVFVRGRGLDAEFEGDLKVTGTTANPQVIGALDMRRGTYDLAGATLIFQSGKIGFVGGSLRHQIDPTLDFVAQSETNGITATLKVTGTARQPRIELSSTPQLPQDEILAQLLFQQSTKSLSPMQLASVAQAAASLGGGVGFDPVGTVRKSLGLDRLAVGSTQPTTGSKGSTTVEAGKYILRNVYVGARQDTSGGTRALVQVDITKHLKAQATVTTGPRAPSSTSTPLQDNGDSIGLSYQFEY